MQYYTVRPGDRLCTIADAFGVPIEAILEVNPGLYPFQLRAGQVILIPVSGGGEYYPPVPRPGPGYVLGGPGRGGPFGPGR